jgi:hypothetical protein
MTNQERFDQAADLAMEDREDCQRIRDVAEERLGIEMTPEQAHKVWASHSANMDAGWLGIESDDEIKEVIECWIERAERKLPPPQTRVTLDEWTAGLAQSPKTRGRTIR